MIGNTSASFLFSSANVYDDESRIIRKDMKGKQYALDTYYYYNNDESGLISSVATTIGGSRRLNYTYNDDGQVTSKSMTLTTPYVNTYTYNDEGFITTDTVTAKNGTFAYDYTYDDNGNITAITKNGTVQQNYAYDENSQLVREDNRDINKSIVYSYDGYGNILNKKEYAFTTGELGAVTDTITYSYDSTWKDKLTSYDGQSITYDSMGNPSSYCGATLDWNGRRLMSYNKDGTSISYEYDSNGLRTSKTVNGVRQEYYYDENGQLLYEIKQGVYELYYKYDADGNLFSITRYRYSDGARHVFYAITNSRGDVIELRENSGAIYATYTYDSWGRCVSVKNSSGNACSVNTVAMQSSIRYRGYVYDYETGLYYLQSRYYDPEVGRFLNADDVDFIGYSGEVLSYNAFAYCENNPVNGLDSTGFFSGEFHYNSTIEIARNYFNYYVSKLIASGCQDVDELFPPVGKFYDEYAQSFHFNVYLTHNKKTKKDSRDDRAKELFKEAIDLLNVAKRQKKLYKKNRDVKYKNSMNANLSVAMYLFGLSLHPIQDKVAHSGKGGDELMLIVINCDPYGPMTTIYFRFHIGKGFDNPEKEYLDTGKKKRTVNAEETEKWIIKMVQAIKKRGLTSEIKKLS